MVGRDREVARLWFLLGLELFGGNGLAYQYKATTAPAGMREYIHITLCFCIFFCELALSPYAPLAPRRPGLFSTGVVGTRLFTFVV